MHLRYLQGRQQKLGRAADRYQMQTYQYQGLIE